MIMISMKSLVRLKMNAAKALSRFYPTNKIKLKLNENCSHRGKVNDLLSKINEYFKVKAFP